jgi:hypothetical protein
MIIHFSELVLKCLTQESRQKKNMHQYLNNLILMSNKENLQT